MVTAIDRVMTERRLGDLHILPALRKDICMRLESRSVHNFRIRGQGFAGKTELTELALDKSSWAVQKAYILAHDERDFLLFFFFFWIEGHPISCYGIPVLERYLAISARSKAKGGVYDIKPCQLMNYISVSGRVLWPRDFTYQQH